MMRAFLFAALLGFSIAEAQTPPTRVRGTIASFDGRVLSVDNVVRVIVTDKTEIVYTQPTPLSEIKAGDFLGVTSVKRGSTLTAIEVRRFPKPVNPGHRPFDGKDDQTMTNATVEATVESTNRRELTMAYEGGKQKIIVPENASVSTLVPGTRAQLVPGAPVNLTADPDLNALRIQVSAPRK
jgi:hypothetical protein